MGVAVCKELNKQGEEYEKEGKCLPFLIIQRYIAD